MARKTAYYKKTNGIVNYEAMPLSDLTSQDVFYTTESYDTQGDYTSTEKERNHHKNYYTDTYDKYFEKYDSVHKSDESNSQDYTTSSISYDERKKKQMKPFKSKSAYLDRQPLQLNRSNHSPVKGNYYFVQEDLYGRKRTKSTRSPKNHNQYDLQTESEKDSRMKTRSPRRKKDVYENLINEEPENDYKKYFEQSTSPHKTSDKYKKRGKFYEGSVEKEKDWSRSLQKENNYQIFAYQEPKQHSIFRNEKDLSRSTFLSPEREIRNHEYRMLAFKDNNSKNISSINGAETVYMPYVTAYDTSHSNETKSTPKNTLISGQVKNIHVFAANLQDQQTIFQTSKDLPNQNNKDKSNLENILSPNKTLDVTPEESSMLANSILESIFKNSGISPKVTIEYMPNKTKQIKKDSFFGNKTVLNYQVNVDVQSNKNILEQTITNEDNMKTTNELEYNKIEDTLHDDYPVTKDYIKVNDTVENQRGSMAITELLLEGQERRRKSSAANSNLIENKKISKSIAENPSKVKSITKRNTSLVLSKGSFPEEKIESHKKRMITDKKQGSMAISNHVEQDTAVQGIPGRTSQNQVENRDQERYKRMSTIGSKIEFTGGLQPPKETVAKEKADTQNRLSARSMGPSETNLLGKSSTILTSKPSVVRTILVEKQPTTFQSRKSYLQSIGNIENLPKVGSKLNTADDRPETLISQSKNSHLLSLERTESKVAATDKQQATLTSQDRVSCLQSIVQKGSHGIYVTGSKTCITDDQQKHLEKLSEVKNEVPTTARLVINHIKTDSQDKIPFVIGNAINSAEVLNTKTQVEKKQESRSSIREVAGKRYQSQKNTQHTISNILPLSGLEKEIENTYQNNERPSKAQETIYTHGEQPHVFDARFSKEPFIENEQITSVIDFTDSEPRASRSKSFIFNQTTTNQHKKSLRNLASALVNFGRRSSTCSKPNIQVRHESTLGETINYNHNNNEHGDNHSSFVQSVEPTSTLYKNKKRVSKAESVKSTKSEDKLQKSIVKPVTRKSETKAHDVSAKKSRSRMSRIFSRSKTSIIDNEGNRQPSKVKSQKSLWGILRQSKSKLPQVPAENTVEASIYEDPPPPLEEPIDRFFQRDYEDNQKKNEDKPCDCFSEYIKHTRECGHFFLGTTLHQEMMNILRLF